MYVFLEPASLSGARITNFTKFLMQSPANFLLALLSGLLPLACFMTWQDIPDNSQVIH
jgi:hypothetical protein